jgi:hypothetical protein
VGAVTVSVLVVDVVAVVADSVLVTVAVFDVLVLLEAAVAAWAVVVVFGVVGGDDVVVVVGVVCEEDSAAAVWLFVRDGLLVICGRVLERLLAMLDAPPEPHPATGTVRIPTSAVLNSIDRSRRLTLSALSLSGI